VQVIQLATPHRTPEMKRSGLLHKQKEETPILTEQAKPVAIHDLSALELPTPTKQPNPEKFSTQER
jgi:hypothetical protein